MKITLSSYDPKWPLDFELEKKELSGVIGDLDPLIEHIGSTSIRGLSAKPILDIMIGIREESLLDTVASRMAQGAFVYLPIYNEQLPFRRFLIGLKTVNIEFPSVLTKENFIEIPHGERKSHIHVVPINSDWWNDHLLFRDFLRNSVVDRQLYEKVKQELSLKNWENGNEYASAKTSCIQSILEKARREKTK
ncbi:GrpB family protein [Metabacillus litoralis]|uniref:GrpB family protein n=1 Tax=Metabacillus litoralis TaxID=152268 RepID=A0A179SYU2_9BACI|nr:GrpB family protein [Metabacillus litoralis]OAS86601.1 hypothetical protein A6K24_03570 [Metabacillus litoralis]